MCCNSGVALEGRFQQGRDGKHSRWSTVLLGPQSSSNWSAKEARIFPLEPLL